MSGVRCVILDDELNSLSYLRMLCDQLPFVEVIKCFDSSRQFVSERQKFDFDICLLDINMPHLNGLEVARQLKGKYIIFVSAHPEFAVDAFDLEAIDFIRKPVSSERLERAMTKASKLVSGRPEKTSFTWNTSYGKSIIFYEEVAWLSTSEVDKRDKVVHYTDGRTLLLKNITLERLLSFLSPSDFIQVNKSEIISRQAVQAHSAAGVTLRSSGAVSLGESYRKAFLEWIS